MSAPCVSIAAGKNHSWDFICTCQENMHFKSDPHPAPSPYYCKALHLEENNFGK